MGEQGRALIVDDDETVRETLSRDLGRLGFTCATAGNGLEAFMRLTESDFDVVLTDLKMPVMDGMGLIRAIAKAGLDTVPVVLSGQGQVSQAVEATRNGAFDFIEKPASIEVVREALGRAARHRRTMRRALATTALTDPWGAAFDSWSDMIVLLDPDGRVLKVNRAVLERLGGSPGHLMGRGCHEALCGDDHGPEDCPFLLELDPNRGRTCELSQKSWGGCFEIRSALLRRSEEGALGSMHVIQDVSSRKCTEEVLREARADAEVLVRSIPSILICLDENRAIHKWNRSAADAFGIGPNEVMGKPFSACGIRWDFAPVEAALARCAGKDSPVRLEDVPFARPDGRGGFVSITLSPIKGRDLRCLGVLILGRDVTERKFLEAQLAQAQRLESIGQLAAGIAHEINTPMQYVGDNTRFMEECFSQLLSLLGAYGEFVLAAREGPLTPESIAKIRAAAEEVDVEYLLEEIPRAIQQSLDGVLRVTKIVRAMRDFSHPPVEEKVAVDINQAIESTVTICRNEWKYVADVETDFDAELPAVPCFPGELNQAVLNLIVNAAHAIADVIGDGSSGKGTIHIRTRRDRDQAEIRIRDTGCGIPPGIREKVWEPFFTTKEVGKGTGQGLAFARSLIVGKHGGSIAFETAAGEGTTFIIRLPLGQETPQGETATQEPTHAEETASAVCG